MKVRLNRLLVLWLAAILLGGTAYTGYLAKGPVAQAADTPEPGELIAPLAPPLDLSTASADQLKKIAFADIRLGKFAQTSDLLSRAAGITHDATDASEAKWAAQFETLCQQFTTERHTQFEKAVANVKLLESHDLATYAMDELSRAYLRADDKDAFRKEKWVDDLVAQSITLAKQYEDSEQWLKALRLYSDLTAVEPAIAMWKDKMKLVTRRVRLLMVYTPTMLKQLQEAEGKERKTAEELLNPPSTQPTAGATPATQPTATTQNSEDTATDWHDVVKGIEYGMLWDALRDAEQNYYRTVSYQGLLKGGLMGVRTIVTTPGLEHAFPDLADKEKAKQFLAVIDSCQQAADAASDNDAETVLSQSLDKLLEANKKTVNIPEEVFISEFADGTFSTLDPFSTIIWPYDSAEFHKTTQGEFGGVGIQIENDAEGNLKIVSPLEDTPAYRAGIKAGEVITQIDHKSAHGIPIDRAVREITGTAGTKVTLTIRSAAGKESDYVITREVIKVASIKGFNRKPGGGWDYMIDPTNGIAYIRLTNFSRKTADDLDDALDQLQRQGAKGIVLDLRYNPGGLLSAAIEVVNKFVKQGGIVSTHPDRETRNQPTSVSAEAGKFRCDLPLVVLVNQYSASASEIVSGALKDDHRALIIGERTFGKGSVQMLYQLDGGPADAKPSLKLTTSHYYLPGGRCIHREENSSTWGVDPDVRVVMTDEQMFTMNETRRDLDVLRDANDDPPSTQPTMRKDLLSVDEQLSAALLVMRLELAGAAL